MASLLLVAMPFAPSSDGQCSMWSDFNWPPEVESTVVECLLVVLVGGVGCFMRTKLRRVWQSWGVGSIVVMARRAIAVNDHPQSSKT